VTGAAPHRRVVALRAPDRRQAASAGNLSSTSCALSPLLVEAHNDQLTLIEPLVRRKRGSGVRSVEVLAC
jgi:hypothetical protein